MSLPWESVRIRPPVRVWIIPTLYMVAALVLGRTTSQLQLPFEVPGQSGFLYSPSTALSILGAIATGMISFTGIVFSMIFVMVQFGSTAYSPRLTGYFLGTKVVQHAIGIFIATFVYSLAALSLVDVGGSGYVPDVPVLLSLLLVSGSALMFIALMQSVTGLQVGNVLYMIGSRGRQVIEELYPTLYVPGAAAPQRPEVTPPATPAQTIYHEGRPVAAAEVNNRLLTQLAQHADALIKVEYSVGDNIPNSGPLLRVYGGRRAILGWQLRRAVILSSQRTIEQDPKYAIRLIVDVACKALSPAVNDPTTAVQAIDQLDDLLRRIGGRQLDVGYGYDQNGVLRIIYPAPTGEDFVGLALDEIRSFGATSLQVVRRLRALLNDLAE
ncbi:MAG TPA: DUF2254 domain-containing protein, partial [Caldilineaceae bacterium]|nr:DUF2254 domain-containing protein [Caldilineaceae bacterium]